MLLGVNYDTGFRPDGHDSRPVMGASDVVRDLDLVVGLLGARAVRISGADPSRIEAVAVEAAARGLAVWFAPFPCELDAGATAEVLLESATRAERLRAGGADVTLVLGCELSLFADGFLPGTSVLDRIDRLREPRHVDPHAVRSRLNAFLGATADAARRRFGGPVTYASGTWEDVNWEPFDVVGVDAYRDDGNAATYEQDVRAHARHGRPVAITEFGCATFRGAAGMGGLGWTVAERGTGTLPEWVVHDDDEPARYLRECVQALDSAGVTAAFWFTFASWGCAADASGYGLMRVEADGTLAPKAAAREFAAHAALRAAPATAAPAR